MIQTYSIALQPNMIVPTNVTQPSKMSLIESDNKAG